MKIESLDFGYEYDGDGNRFHGISCFIDDCYWEYNKVSDIIAAIPEMAVILKLLINYSNDSEKMLSEHPGLRDIVNMAKNLISRLEKEE